MAPTFGVESAPDGGLRVFVDVSEHECRVAGVDPNAAPASDETRPVDREQDAPTPDNPTPAA